MQKAIWTETTDQTFDPRDLPAGHSIPFTSLEAFVRKQTGLSNNGN